MLIWNTATENDWPDNTSPGDKGVRSITPTPCGAPTIKLIMQQALLLHLYFLGCGLQGQSHVYLSGYNETAFLEYKQQ